MAEGVAGDDLAFDEGNAYATNPQQTVLKFPGMGFTDAKMNAE
jgi:hypothetical protein